MASNTLPRFISSLPYLCWLMLSTARHARPGPSSWVAIASTRASAASGKRPICNIPDTGDELAITTPGSRNVPGSATQTPITSAKRRSAIRSASTPFVATSTVTSGAAARSWSKAASASWVLVVTMAMSPGCQSTSAGLATAAMGNVTSSNPSMSRNPFR